MQTDTGDRIAVFPDRIDPLSIRARIIGSWQLVEYSLTSDEGHVHYPLGPDAQGLIVYSADGFMSAQLMKSERPLYRSAYVHDGTMHEQSTAAGSYLAYSGPYRIDEEESVVYHTAALSLYPNWTGEERKRHVQFAGELMTLSTPPIAVGTTRRRPSVVWRRITSGVG